MDKGHRCQVLWQGKTIWAPGVGSLAWALSGAFRELSPFLLEWLNSLKAVTCVPAILFSEDLISAYPEAKVILTTRDPSAWWKSYDAALQGMWRSKRARIAARLDPSHFGKAFTFAKGSVSLFLGPTVPVAEEEESKERFTEHYDRVRRLVPRDRLLEYEVGEGWETLCAFLGQTVPNAEFPRINDTKGWRGMINLWAGMIFLRSALKITLPVLLLVYYFLWLRR